MISCRLRLVLHVIRVEQGDEVRVAVGYLCQVILVRKHGVPIGIGQRESVLEVTGDVLPLESGILDIAIHDLLVERAVRKLIDWLTIHIWSLTVEKQGAGCQHCYQGNDEKEN